MDEERDERSIKLIIKYASYNLHINLACLSVCLYPINVKTADPIVPKFFMGHHVTTGKVYEDKILKNVL